MRNCKTENELSGMTWIGNRNLLNHCDPHGRRNLVGVFVGAQCSSRSMIDQEEWAIAAGFRKECIVGLFHSVGERNILKHVLRRGGCAVWILDHALPTIYGRLYSRAIVEGRLLVVSCFWIPHGSYTTLRFCAHLVAHLAGCLVVWKSMAQATARARVDYMAQLCASARKKEKATFLR